MGWVKLQDDFTGMNRDQERNNLPPGKLWLMKNMNFFSGKQGSLTPLGDIKILDQAQGTTVQFVSFVGSYFWGSGSGGRVICADGKLYVNGTTDLGAWAADASRSFVYVDRFYSFDGGDLYVTDGSTNYGAFSPPVDGVDACMFLDRLAILGDTTGSPNLALVTFSEAGDLSTYPTDGNFNTPARGLKIHAHRDTLFVWTTDGLYRWRGTIPPPGGNLVRSFVGPAEQPLGVPIQWKEWTIWQSQNGIWMTDGNNIVDVTKRAGVKSYWASLTKTDSTTDDITAHIGLWNDFIFVSYSGGHLVIDLESFNACIIVENSTWGQLWIANGDYTGALYAAAVKPSDEKWYSYQIERAWTGIGSTDRTYFDVPSIETGIYLDGFEIKDFKNIGLAGKIKTDTDPGNDLHTQLGMDVSYSTYADSVLANSGTTQPRRVYPLNKSGPGLGIKFDSFSNIANRIDSIWADVNVREAGRSS